MVAQFLGVGRSGFWWLPLLMVAEFLMQLAGAHKLLTPGTKAKIEGNKQPALAKQRARQRLVVTPPLPPKKPSLSCQLMRRRSKAGLRTACFNDLLMPVSTPAETQLFMELIQEPKYALRKGIDSEVMAIDWNLRVHRSSKVPSMALDSNHEIHYKDGPSLRKFQEFLKEAKLTRDSRMLSHPGPAYVQGLAKGGPSMMAPAQSQMQPGLLPFPAPVANTPWNANAFQQLGPLPLQGHVGPSPAAYQAAGLGFHGPGQAPAALQPVAQPMQPAAMQPAPRPHLQKERWKKRSHQDLQGL